MAIRSGEAVLAGRYSLLSRLPSRSEVETSEPWVATGPDEEEYLVKLWPFAGDQIDDLQRALWDAELRTMYRVGSSPGAEHSLLVIREAGVDHLNRCFVMVMHTHGASGFSVLGDIITQRRDHAWLETSNIDNRRELWTGLNRVASGLTLLHSQSVLHRNVDLDNVFLSSALGPSSFRLGGFEWSVRIGEYHLKEDSPIGWSTPPEFFETSQYAYQLETDWYGFGMLAIRCLLNTEAFRNDDPIARNRRVHMALEKATGRQLTDLVRKILLRFIAPNRADRLGAYQST